MLKIIHLLIPLLTLCLLQPVFADEAYTIDQLEEDTSEYLPAEDFPELEEQIQHLYIKDSVDGKALDSTTWRSLTKDLNYGDTLDYKKEPDEKRESKSWNLPSINSTLTKYVLFAIVITALLYLLYRLIGSALFAANNKITKSKEATFEILHDDEQMMQKDLNSLLEEALLQKDYKTVIRILFIQSLQELQASHWIKWKKEKTNRDYLNELMPRTAFVPFGSMVLLYEKAWYSESMPSQEDLDAFNTFKQQLKSV
jgi:hypothetical protein